MEPYIDLWSSIVNWSNSITDLWRLHDSWSSISWQELRSSINNKHEYGQSQVLKPTSGIEWAECSLIIGTGYWVEVFSLILDSSVGLLAGIQSFDLRPWARILHSEEEYNLSPSDSKIACPCQSIEINNNRQWFSKLHRCFMWLNNCLIVLHNSIMGPHESVALVKPNRS